MQFAVDGHPLVTVLAVLVGGVLLGHWSWTSTSCEDGADMTPCGLRTVPDRRRKGGPATVAGTLAAERARDGYAYRVGDRPSADG
jgi:hypothetical protein